MAMEHKIKRASNARGHDDQDSDERVVNAKLINQIITGKSKDASLVITNLPPILKE
jgi:hypothetical protein